MQVAPPCGQICNQFKCWHNRTSLRLELSYKEYKFNLVNKIIQAKDSIPWVRCASGNVFWVCPLVGPIPLKLIFRKWSNGVKWAYSGVYLSQTMWEFSRFSGFKPDLLAVKVWSKWKKIHGKEASNRRRLWWIWWMGLATTTPSTFKRTCSLWKEDPNVFYRWHSLSLFITF